MPAAVLLLLVFAAAGTGAAKLPSYLLPKCSRSSPPAEMNACLTRIANAGASRLADGDKKLGIASMRPLLVPRMALAQGTSQVGLNITWEPAELWGFGESRVENVKSDYPAKKTTFDVVVPQFVLSGQYKSKGQVLLLPITGSGSSNITAYNLRVHYGYEWPIKKKADGKEYFVIQNPTINIIGVDRMHLHFEGLFNGDRLLGDQMNVFLNENWRELLKELGPGMAEAVGGVLRLVVQRIADLIPADDLYDP